MSGSSTATFSIGSFMFVTCPLFIERMVKTVLAHGFKIHLKGPVPIWWVSNGIIKRWGPKEGSEIMGDNGDTVSLQRLLGLAPRPFAVRHLGEEGSVFLCTPYSVLFLHTGDKYGPSSTEQKYQEGKHNTALPCFKLLSGVLSLGRKLTNSAWDSLSSWHMSIHMYTFAPRHLHLCGVSSATDTHGREACVEAALQRVGLQAAFC